MEKSKDNGVLVIKVSEEDLADPRVMSEQLENLLKNEGETRVVVDLSAVETIYSLQIGTLVAMHVMCYENVAVMKLCGASRKVRTLLRMVGLESLMELHHGTDVAVQSFASTAAAPAVREKPADPRVKK